MTNGATIRLGSVPLDWQIAGIGDVTGDGKADIIWRNSSNGVVAVWLMSGSKIISVGFPGSTSLDWDIQAVRDVDGNGQADILWRNSNSGVVGVWLMNGANDWILRIPGVDVPGLGHYTSGGCGWGRQGRCDLAQQYEWSSDGMGRERNVVNWERSDCNECFFELDNSEGWA